MPESNNRLPDLDNRFPELDNWAGNTVVAKVNRA